MSRLLPTIFVLLVVLPGLALAQPPTTTTATVARLAYFSPQRAFAQSVDGKDAQAKLSAIQAERTKEIEARSGKLKALQATLQQGATMLTEGARRQREQEIARFEVDLNRFIQDTQADFLGVQREFENAFLTKVWPALDAVAKEKGLLLVLNEDAGLIAWADPMLDVTPDVLARLSPR